MEESNSKFKFSRDKQMTVTLARELRPAGGLHLSTPGNKYDIVRGSKASGIDFFKNIKLSKQHADLRYTTRLDKTGLVNA